MDWTKQKIKENHSVVICAHVLAKVVKDAFCHPVVEGNMILHLLSSEYLVENFGLSGNEWYDYALVVPIINGFILQLSLVMIVDAWRLIVTGMVSIFSAFPELQRIELQGAINFDGSKFRAYQIAIKAGNDLGLPSLRPRRTGFQNRDRPKSRPKNFLWTMILQDELNKWELP